MAVAQTITVQLTTNRRTLNVSEHAAPQAPPTTIHEYYSQTNTHVQVAGPLTPGHVPRPIRYLHQYLCLHSNGRRYLCEMETPPKQQQPSADEPVRTLLRFAPSTPPPKQKEEMPATPADQPTQRVPEQARGMYRARKDASSHRRASVPLDASFDSLRISTPDDVVRCLLYH